MRNNEFSLYHAKQNLILWLFGVIGSVVSSILMMICIGAILWIVVAVAWVVFSVMGIVASNKGEPKPIPLIGKWGEEWFKGIKKA